MKIATSFFMVFFLMTSVLMAEDSNVFNQKIINQEKKVVDNIIHDSSEGPDKVLLARADYGAIALGAIMSLQAKIGYIPFFTLEAILNKASVSTEYNKNSLSNTTVGFLNLGAGLGNIILASIALVQEPLWLCFFIPKAVVNIANAGYRLGYIKKITR